MEDGSVKFYRINNTGVTEVFAGYWPDNDTHSLIYMLMSHDEVIDKMSERLIEFEPLLTQKLMHHSLI